MAHMLPLVALRHVRYPPLKPAVEKQPAVLVCKRHHQQLVQQLQLADTVCAHLCPCRLKGGVVDRAACSQQAIPGMAYSEVSGYVGCGDVVCGIHCALCVLCVESE
jgi:hypothetical protein